MASVCVCEGRNPIELDKTIIRPSKMMLLIALSESIYRWGEEGKIFSSQTDTHSTHAIIFQLQRVITFYMALFCAIQTLRHSGDSISTLCDVRCSSILFFPSFSISSLPSCSRMCSDCKVRACMCWCMYARALLLSRQFRSHDTEARWVDERKRRRSRVMGIRLQLYNGSWLMVRRNYYDKS